MTTDAYVVPKISERRFQGQVVRLAQMLGWKTWHDNATSAPRVCPSCKAPLKFARNAKGLPDLVLVRRPRVVWAELKSERNHLTDDQWEYIEALRASRQEAYVWRPSDWKAIERILR